MTDLHAALGTALGPLYRVEREVRPVGDCRMFVASEVPDGPELLVKVLPGKLSLAVDASLFEREVILLADRLRHPALAAPRGGGRAGAFIYHARGFVQGTTLRALVTRSGELPLRQAVVILRDVLTGLAHAHAGQVVHGDLKPENVLVAAGQTLVADTGIVDAVERSLEGGKPGVATATLCAGPYVAPERRSGGTPTPAGPRDDMFAVGVVAHEMLTGRPPAPESDPLEEVRSLPAWLAELVRRCLAPEPAGRWPDAAAALATMGRASGGGVGGVGGVGGAPPP